MGPTGRRDELRDRGHDRVPELAVRLSVRHDDFGAASGSIERPRVETHQALRLDGSESTGRSLRVLGSDDEDLAAVLVVSSGERPRDVVGAEEAVAESVAPRLVLRAVCPEIVPKFVREDVAIVDVARLKDAPERAFATDLPAWWVREYEGDRRVDVAIVERDDEHTLAVLRDPVSCVVDPEVGRVSDAPQRPLDRPPGLTPVVRSQILDVLEQEHGRTLDVGDLLDVEEQCPLRRILEPVCPAEGVLLGDPGE